VIAVNCIDRSAGQPLSHFTFWLPSFLHGELEGSSPPPITTIPRKDDTDFMSDMKKGFSKAVRKLTDSSARKTAEVIQECTAWLELMEDGEVVEVAPEEPVADDEDEEIDPDAEDDDQDDEVETEEVAAE